MPLSYTIDAFFRDLLPKDEEARKELKIQLAADKGCRDSIIVGVIRGEPTPILLDGHARVALVDDLRSEGHEIADPQIVRKEFDTREEAARWVFTNQNARRNWRAEDRARAVLLNEQAILKLQESARKNERKGKPLSSEKERVQVDKQLAAIARVSTATIYKVRKVLKSEDPEAQKLFAADPGERPSIAEAARIARQKERKQKLKERAAEAASQVPPSARIEPSPSEWVNQVICGDSAQVLARIPDGEATMYVCSPPYCIDHEDVGYDVYRYESFGAWLDKMRQIFAQAYRTLRKGGRMAINYDLTNDRSTVGSTKLPVRHFFESMLYDLGFKLLDEICWFKQSTVGHRPNWGTYCSPKKPNVRRNHEYIQLFYKETPYLAGDDSLIDILPKEFEMATVSTWNYDAKRRQAAELSLDSFWYVKPEQRKPGGHPCPYPPRLVELLLKGWTRRNDLIVDPFLGSGTTAVVAAQLGRRYCGVDLSPDYCAEARARIAAAINISAERAAA